MGATPNDKKTIEERLDGIDKKLNQIDSSISRCRFYVCLLFGLYLGTTIPGSCNNPAQQVINQLKKEKYIQHYEKNK